MPPKQKTKLVQDFIECESCRCIIDSRDVVHHSNRNDISLCFIDLDKFNHGYVFDKVAFAKVQCVDIAAAPQIMQQLNQPLVFLNPSVMRLCGLAIGTPAVLNKTSVVTVWPLQQTLARLIIAAFLPEHLKQLSLNEDQYCSVEQFSQPCLIASEIHLQSITSKLKPEIALTKSFKHFLKESLNGTFIRNGSTVNVSYCGQKFSFIIKLANYFSEDCTDPNSQTKLVIQDLTDSNSVTDSVANRRKALVSRFNLIKSITASDIDCKLSVCENKMTKLIVSDQNQGQPSCENDARSAESLFVRISSDTAIYLTSNEDELDGLSNYYPPIGGMKFQRQQLREMLKLCFSRTQDLGIPVIHGALLYGPSGSGKTVTAQHVVRECGYHSVYVHGAEVWSKYYGESEGRVTSFFHEASIRSPCVLIIDEIDVLCPRRDSSRSDIETRVTANLLANLDKLVVNKNTVFVIGITSKRDNLDPGLRRPNRLDREIEFGVPPAEERTEILSKILGTTVTALHNSDIARVAEQAHGFLAADLVSIVKEATLNSIRSGEIKFGEKTNIDKEDLACSDQRSSAKLSVLSMDDLIYGLQHVRPSSLKEISIEVPKVSWSDIGGQGDLKHKLKQAVEWPLKHPEAFSRLGIKPPKGLLMYGPPGCSKTMIAKALANESGVNFIAIKGPELFSKWVGESERAVREVFRKARGAAPCIIFFDEIDAVAGKRGSGDSSGSDVSDRVLSQLLTEIDGVEQLHDVTIVAATNRPDRIDKALMRPGRLDRIVYVPLPDSDTRKEILKIQFRRMPVSSDVDIDQLVLMTSGYSGAEVTALCHEAAMCAMEENISTEFICMKHFVTALTIVTPRLLDVTEQYNKYAALFGVQSI